MGMMKDSIVGRFEAVHSTSSTSSSDYGDCSDESGSSSLQSTRIPGSLASRLFARVRLHSSSEKTSQRVNIVT